MTHSQTSAASCPVPLELLALLLRCDEGRLRATMGELPETLRAALAMYCFERYHMRRLGFAIAVQCSQHSLETAGGTIGRQVFELAGDASETGGDAVPHGRHAPIPARAAA